MVLQYVCVTNYLVLSVKQICFPLNVLHQVWFFLEGGLIGNFGRDGKAPVSDQQNSQRRKSKMISSSDR